MNIQVFCRCADQLLKGEQFSRITFLRWLSQICGVEQHKQVYLALYAYYQFFYLRNTQNSLMAVQKGLSLQEESISASFLLAIKAAILTTIEKHTESLQSFKQAIQIIHLINKKKLTVHPFHKKIFPIFASKIIETFDFSRGRRQFLVLLDEIKGQIQNRSTFDPLLDSVNSRMGEIRESMRCAGRSQHEKKLLMSSSSMGILGSMRHEVAESSTSIYINRLYQQRRKTLGQRDKSNGFKKANISNPYQLNLHEARQSAQCYLM